MTDLSVDAIIIFNDCVSKYSYFVPNISSIYANKFALVFCTVVVAQR